MTSYIIKLILCSAIFLFAYKVLLEKGKMHRFNRLYLLLSLLVSFVIPAITFSVATPVLPVAGNEIFNAALLQDSKAIQIFSPVNNTNYTFPVLLTIYLAVTALLLFRFVMNLKNILSTTRNNPGIPYKEAKIILIKEDLTPHSFLNYIFINEKEYTNGDIESEILAHEYTHIRQKHSYDVLFMNIMLCFLWFNPFLFFYTKAIQLNHEFLADEAVIDAYQDVAGYQFLLINKAGKNSSYHLTSQFNYSITKKRLIMMTKTRSLTNTLCRQLALIPVVALSVFVFSTRSVAQENTVIPTIKQQQAPSTQEGVSQELMNEYEQIVNKTKNEKGYPVFSKFSDADVSRLETIYLAMSKEQQAKQVVAFMPAPPALPRVAPTQAQIESWKNAKVYGLWINNKRVSNAELNKYQPVNFAQVFVSKLSKNAINYGNHYYQVNLMTIEEYNAYSKKTDETKNEYHLVFRMRNKQS